MDWAENPSYLVEYEFSESIENENLRISDLQEPIEKKLILRSDSSDSRSGAKLYLRKAFVEKLFDYGVECQEENENCISIKLPDGFMRENFTSDREVVLYSKVKKDSLGANENVPAVPEDLPELITIMFAFDSGTALYKLKKISESTLDKNWVIVFNGMDLQNIEDLKRTAQLIPRLYSIIWINAALYPDILPLYNSTCEIVELKRKHKKKLEKKEKKLEKKLKKKEKLIKKLKEALMEQKRENDELRRRLGST